MKTQPTIPSPPTPPNPPSRRPAILLVDGNRQRQFARAAAMRLQGVTVSCADNGADAYGLWDPQLYGLVLIDFRGADDQVRAFYHHLRSLATPPNIGLYRSSPPFIVRSTGMTMPRDGASNGSLQDAVDAVVARAHPRRRNGLSEAARRIAFTRSPRTRLDPEPHPRPAESSPAPESNAEIAARVLGGDA